MAESAERGTVACQTPIAPTDRGDCCSGGFVPTGRGTYDWSVPTGAAAAAAAATRCARSSTAGNASAAPRPAAPGQDPTEYCGGRQAGQKRDTAERVVTR